MKKIIFCFSFVCMGLLSSCVDKNEIVEDGEDSKPSWLGESIYGELQNPAGKGLLSGTFNTYLRLVDDIGYAEVLQRTGSNTVFPANDEAFDRFFRSGTWPGVNSYEDLTMAQKKLLLNGSMLKNALLTDMLSSVMSDGKLTPGMAVKHETNINRIDSVTYYPLATAKEVYPNNPNWARFDNGIAVVCDETNPMLVHFTEDYMLSNGITTTGANSDFSIIVGGEYKSPDTYIYRNRVTAANITCQNGYIHQVENVIVPPGNLAQVMKKADDLTIISHLFDRFAVPYYNRQSDLTSYYNSWYKEEQDAGHNMAGIINPDSIFEVRYLSDISQGEEIFSGTGSGSGSERLSFDIGWNEYYMGNTGQELLDVGALFIPNDETIKDYFVNGSGKPIIERYCKDSEFPNTAENVIKNIDFIPLNVVNRLLSNMMQTSFKATVPSKFDKITDIESGDFMGITTADLAQKDGVADVRIANNGVIYVLNRVLSPNSYSAVSAPTLFNTGMNIIGWMIDNKSMIGSSNNPYSIDLDFYAYLLAMKANFALFLPTDDAFSLYYIDPARINRTGTGKNGPTAVRYVWRNVNSDPQIRGVIHSYNPRTGVVGDSVDALNLSESTMPIVKSQLADLMNYNTIVLNSGETLGANNYYKAKNGGGLKINMNNKTVAGGGQIHNGLPVSHITNTYEQANGYSYALDHLIQGPLQSVYTVLNDHAKYPQFSKFFEVLEALSNTELLRWALDYDTSLSEEQRLTLNSYRVFTDKSELPNCLDYNVRFFNMYNYTVYVPNNDAMDKAHEAGLPSVSEIMNIYENDVQNDRNDPTMKRLVLNMLIPLRDFAYYHFQNTSIYADNNVDGGNYSTFLVDAQLNNKSLSVSGGNGRLTVTDATGRAHVVNASSPAANIMTRDFEFEKGATTETATYVNASSFAVLHEISEPLYFKSNLSSGISNAKSRRMSVRR